jgi:hypothetical protein
MVMARKQKTKIFTFIKDSPNSMVASLKIARFISHQLELPIVDDSHIADESLRTLIIVNGAFAFCAHLPALGKAIFEARNVVWVQNDYTIVMPKEESGAESPFRKAFRDRKAAKKSPANYWTTVAVNARATVFSSYVNWNCLTFDTKRNDKTIAERRKKSQDNLIYYGSFRRGRVDAFDTYFKHPKMKVVISSPSKKFYENYKDDHITCIGPFTDADFYQALGSYGMGLYLEDEASNKEFHSPPNRFYEMLSAGLPMVFAPGAGTMLRKAGYNPEPWEASSSLAIARIMDKREIIRKDQWHQWGDTAANERMNLENHLQAAWTKLEDV